MKDNKALKYLTLITGVLTLLLGVYTLVRPMRTFLAIGWILGILLFVNGIELVILSLSKEKKEIGACILGVLEGLAGIILLFSGIQRFITDVMAAYMVGAIILIYGIFQIAGGTKVYKHAECRNINSISIEMCCSGNSIVSEKTINNTAHLCAELCKYIGITADTVDTFVLRHYDVLDKQCPAQWATENSAGWTTFKEKVKAILRNEEGLTMEQYAQFTGMTADKMMEQMLPSAEKNIKTRLVLEAIAKAENIEISDEKIDEKLAEMAKSYDMEVEKLKELVGEAEKQQMKDDMAVQEAIDFLVENAVEK